LKGSQPHGAKKGWEPLLGNFGRHREHIRLIGLTLADSSC